MTSTYEPKRDEPLFRRDGDLLVPGALAKGPWYEGTLHGSAMLAAIARGAEQHPTEVPRQVIRLTVDMMRAAPMAPLRVESTTVRAGKSIDHVEIAMYADEALCVRGTALRTRIADIEVDTAEAPAPSPRAPELTNVPPPPFARPGVEEPAFHHAIDIHPDSTESTVWFRLTVPVVEGEENTSLVTIAAVADWTYAGPTLLRAVAGGEGLGDNQAVYAINADTTINTFRPLSGEWVGLRTASHIGSLGAGTSGADLFDASGPLGFASQSVLVRGPSGAPIAVREVSG